MDIFSDRLFLFPASNCLIGRETPVTRDTCIHVSGGDTSVSSWSRHSGCLCENHHQNPTTNHTTIYISTINNAAAATPASKLYSLNTQHLATSHTNIYYFVLTSFKHPLWLHSSCVNAVYCLIVYRLYHCNME